MIYPIIRCCPCAEEQKTNVTLTFERKELIYDVSNYSYVEADIMQEDDECRRHQVFDISQDGNVDRVTRVLNTAHAETVEMLYPYTKQEITENEVLDDRLTEPEKYSIVLTIPSFFSQTTVELLSKLIHEYFVCRVLADWMSITNSDSEGKWEKKFTLIKEKIKSSLVSRQKHVRRRLKPF